jgi:hypothetical protein
MKRHESRNISRRRLAIEALSPCTKYSTAMGVNPFAHLFQMAGIRSRLANQELTEEERQLQHHLKMESDKKSAKARQNRKRNKV